MPGWENLTRGKEKARHVTTLNEKLARLIIANEARAPPCVVQPSWTAHNLYKLKVQKPSCAIHYWKEESPKHD